MSITRVQNNDPGQSFYNLKNALWRHIANRSEKCFETAAKARENIKTVDCLNAYASKMREEFIENLGGLPYDNTLPLNAKTVGIIEEKELKIEKVIFESRPNVYVTANLYLPEKRKNPSGAVLFQLGHSDVGKAHDQYQRVARAIASAGLIVLVMDPVGQGERFSYYEPSEGKEIIYATVDEHQYAGNQCVLTGDNIARYFIADAMRAVDYLISRPEVDSEKIGATGSSGGGTATCHAMICDERIKAAAPGTFVTTRQAYLYSGNAQDSEQIWMNATKNGFDHHEILMCFAPKPVMLLTVESDFFLVEGADEVFETGKHFYEMSGNGDKIFMVRDESMHKYTDMLACSAAEFFARFLNGEEKKADKDAITSIEQKKLWCTEKGQVKIEFPHSEFVFDENLKRLNEMKPQKPFREFLLEKVNFERKPAPLRLRTFGAMYECGLKVVPYMWFSQKDMPNYALMFTPLGKETDETVICLWDNGTNNIEDNIYKIRNICKEGKAAFVLDLAGMGKCAPDNLNSGYAQKGLYGILDKLTKDLFFLGDSLCALRVFELMYAVKMLREKFNSNVSINASGLSSFYALLCNEIEPQIEITLSGDIESYREIVKSKYYEGYNIAGVLLPGAALYMDSKVEVK